MSHEGKRGKKRHGHKSGACTYCGRIHKKGKSRGTSCRGHSNKGGVKPKAVTV